MTLLRAEGITVTLSVDGDERAVLDHVDLAVAPGEIVDIVGPSGSGKSTLLRALAWMNPLATGALFLDDIPHTDFTPQQWRAHVTMLPQEPALIGSTIRCALLLPWELSIHQRTPQPDDDTMRSLLDAAGLEDVALDREVGRLSVGQQARVAFIRTILIRPKVLLLDEADAALDPVSTSALSALTARFLEVVPGSAVVRVRHRESDGLANRRLRVEGGSICVEDAS